MGAWKYGVPYFMKRLRFSFGEIPKRLKGLPWKGSRSLIAARGFKSLFLRLIDDLLDEMQVGDQSTLINE